MCRYKFLWGCCMLAFGLGVLLGLNLEGGFWCHCFGFGVMVAGILVTRK